jgi:cell division septation protein DedD
MVDLYKPDDDFDEDIATAATSSQVSQFDSALDDLNDMDEDDEVMSEFLSGMTDREGVRDTDDDDRGDLFDEEDDLFDELFEEEDTYTSSQEEAAKNSILQSIRDNPIAPSPPVMRAEEKQDAFRPLDDHDKTRKKTTSSAPRSHATRSTSNSHADAGKKTLMGSVVVTIGLSLIVALGGYTYTLHQDVKSLSGKLTVLEEGGALGAGAQDIAKLSSDINEIKRQMVAFSQKVDDFSEQSSEGEENVADAIALQKSHATKLQSFTRTLASVVQDVLKLETTIEKLQTAPPPVVAKVAPVKKVVKAKKVAKQPKASSVKKKPAVKITTKAKWKVNVASFNKSSSADKVLKNLRGRGIDVKKSRVNIKGKTWYRLFVDGFTTKTQADKYVAKLKKLPGLTDPWVSKI